MERPGGAGDLSGAGDGRRGAVVAALPRGPIGFAVTALLASAFCGRQSLDARARAVASAWEDEGPYEAFGAAEALGADEADPRLVRAGAAAIAARFADEVAAPTLFILIGGLPGVAFAARVDDRRARLPGKPRRRRLRPRRRDPGGLDDHARRAVRARCSWRSPPAPGPAAWRAVGAPATRPTAPAEAALVAALGDPQRDDPAYLRRALALYRRAAAAEFVALGAAAVAAALAG